MANGEHGEFFRIVKGVKNILPMQNDQFSGRFFP
jgi:hypothetical protein